MSLAYTAFYLPVKPLKSNSFTGFKPSSLRSPAGRLKLDYRIISNVITIATYATSVPFVWKNGEIFEFRYLVLPLFFKESRVKHCCLPRLKLMKNDKFRNPWKICCEKNSWLLQSHITALRLCMCPGKGWKIVYSRAWRCFWVKCKKLYCHKFSCAICWLPPPATSLYFAWFTKIAEAPILCVGYVVVSFKGT